MERNDLRVSVPSKLKNPNLFSGSCDYCDGTENGVLCRGCEWDVRNGDKGQCEDCGQWWNVGEDGHGCGCAPTVDMATDDMLDFIRMPNGEIMTEQYLLRRYR